MTLTLQFVPYYEIEKLSSQERINKLLMFAKKDKIVLLEGRLTSQEEAALIQKTMQEIDKRFKGIELSVIYPDSSNTEFLSKIKNKVINFLLGNRNGFTIIGPANVVKEIKHDPDKIQLFTK